jgi:D-alanine-D-alanine ligase
MTPADFGRVGVLLGGASAEREISLLSGYRVLTALHGCGVDAYPFDPAHFSLAELAARQFDRVFIALHGRGGEDGAIQGALEWLRIPYTGSGVQASALAFDKVMAKRVWVAERLPTPAWREVDAGTDWMRIVAELGDALIVKPAREGSTIGITRVFDHDQAQLADAHTLAARYDRSVLVEEMIAGRELTCAILGAGAQARALPLIEIVAPDGNYDYQNKYFTDDTRYLCPAPLEAGLATSLQALCLRAYRALGARGWGRIDLMLRETAGEPRPYLLELNTSPGMTAHSLVPMAAAVEGTDYAGLVLEILAGAALEARP